MVVGAPVAARAQRTALVPPVSRVAAFVPGAIFGTVQDETGAPIEGVVVSALGATTTVAVTDAKGRFEFGKLSAGPYLLRAHFTGYVAPRPQIVQVRPSARSTSSIALHRSGESVPVFTAGVGASGTTDTVLPPTQPDAGSSTAAGDPGEAAWRIRHARRSVLKDARIPDDLLAEGGVNGPGRGGSSPIDALGWIFDRPTRVASNLFAVTPFSGQVNLLTTGSFDTPQQLFSPDALSRNTAYVRVSAPVGGHADWTVRGALTRADLTSWIVAGSYTTRTPARHGYDIGLSYSTQQYDGGNPLALRDVTEGSRNAGTVYAYDSFALAPAAVLSYGASFARYDYLDHRNLLSPRVELTVTPAEGWRLSALVSRRTLAPGAEEFLPPGDSGIWLPPQRTFSAVDPGRRFESERALQTAVSLERDFGPSTITVRAFRQRVADQLVALFGADMPLQPSAKLGHYFVANVGQAKADGYSAGLRTVIANRVHGSIGYTAAHAELSPADELRYLLVFAPSTMARKPARIHDVSTSIETEVPETATRLLVLYRVSNGFARAGVATDAAQRPALDGRFDVQVRQSLPFMNFSNARWEMLIAVRNFFRETSPDQSLYDELLVARPPKRVVGGVTLHF
jgi:hypothetical protein